MKKLIAILCAAVLLATSIFGSMMLTVSAEDTAANSEVADTVVMPTFVDEDGDPINVYHTMENVPTSVVSESGFKSDVGLVKNSSNLPFTTLFSIVADENPKYETDQTKNWDPTPEDIVTGSDVPYNQVNGVMVYVEIPENGTLSDATADTEATWTTDKFRFSFYIYGYTETEDADTGEVTRSSIAAYSHNSGGKLFVLEKGGSAWVETTKYYYGVELKHGFKGYVYMPFSRTTQVNKFENSPENSYVNSIQINQLTPYPDQVYDTTNEVAQYGYASEENPLIVSAPVFVLKDEATDHDATPPSAESVVYGGKEYFFKNQVDKIELTDTKKPVVSKVYKSSYSSSFAIDTTFSAPINGVNMYKVAEFKGLDGTSTSSANAFQPMLIEFDFSASNTATAGVLFYVKLKGASNPSFSLQTNVNKGAESTSAYACSNNVSNSNKTGMIKYLKKGTTAWVDPTQSNESDSKSYWRETDISEDFEGYIYISWTTYGGTAQGYFTNLGAINFVQLYMSNNGTDAETGAYNDIYISEPIFVDKFDTSLSSVCAYYNNDSIDILTGETVNVDTDYQSADEFYGNVELVERGNSDMLAMNFATSSYTNNTIMGIGLNEAYDSYNSSFTGSLVESSNPIIKFPLSNLKCATAGSYTSQRLVSINTNIDLTTNEGFLIYVSNKTSGIKSIGIATNATYVETVDGTPTQTSGYLAHTKNKGAFEFLADGSDEWDELGSGATYKAIPANTSGWLYVSADDFYTTYTGNGTIQITTLSDIQILVYNQAFSEGDVLQFGYPMLVTNFTTDNAGMAFVNGSEVAQDMWTGDFTVPYDQNGSLTVDILDLVRAKANTDPDFTTFREAYLNDYFDDADYTVVSAAFSLRSLAYTDADASTILSENPDRGYRTEMVLYLKNGTPDPLYKSVYYVGDQTDEQENVSGLEFETREAAQAYIDARVAEESTFKLTYYQNKDPEVATGTIEPQYTYAIDKEVYKTKTSYYVYRAFESYEVARAFMYEQMLLRGDSGYAIYTLYADTEEVDEDGNTIHNTYYRVGYDERCVFTGDSEEDQSKAIDRQIRKYFKIDLTDDYEEVMQEGIDSSKLTLTYLYLSDWNGASVSDLTAVEELPDSALDTVKLYFERMKKRGLKTEVRFSYNVNVSRTWRYSDANVTFNNGTIAETPNGTQPYNDDWLAENCANEGTILKHIEQLAPIVAEYKGSIHNISNGFIGYAGEMAYGYQYPAVDYVTVQKAIVEQLCVPNDLYFSTRSPSYRQMIANADADWEYLDSICINNDAIYGEQTNSGWNSGGYQVGNPENHTTDWWAWMTENAYKTPQGGETFTQKVLLNVDGNDVADYSKMLDGYDVMLELVHHRHTSFSYWHGYLEGLNKEYNIMKNWMNPDSEYYAPVTTEILENMGIAYDPAWFNGSEERNVYEFIRDHLGYRLVASKATVNYDKDKSDKVSVQMSFKNYGFAAAFNMSASLAILDRNGNVVSEKVAGDPSAWYNLAPDYYTTDRTSSAQGDVLTHNISAELDAPLAGGTYYLAFRLDNTADEAARLANDVEFVNGYNILGTFNFIG